jgi:glucosamine--fructose-6-phosphate aminotransferase (isomerizing)
MHNHLWADIQAQGENLANVITHLYGAERERLEAAAQFLQGDAPVVLAGVASAEYVSMPAAVFLARRGRPAQTLCAADAFYTHLPMLRSARVVINTRSGETAEVVRLVQALKAEGIPFLALTNEPESTAARLADHILWANTRKDDLVSINVVTGMMTTTLLLAAACGEEEALRGAFEALPAQLAGCVEQSARRGEEFLRLLGDKRPIYQLYRGASKGAANCARLVLEEVARTPGVAMEAAEFRQGPNEVIDEDFGAIVYIPAGKPGELNRALVMDILGSGGTALAVGETAGLPEHARLACFPLGGVCDELRPVLEVVPAQVLAYHLAQAQGYTPGTTRYITKIILTEEGIPNQIT